MGTDCFLIARAQLAGLTDQKGQQIEPWVPQQAAHPTSSFFTYNLAAVTMVNQALYSGHTPVQTKITDWMLAESSKEVKINENQLTCSN